MAWLFSDSFVDLTGSQTNDSFMDNIRNLAFSFMILGVIVFTILGGKNPFLEDTLHMTLQQIRQAHYTFEAPEWKGISTDAKKFVRALLTSDPEQRLTSEEALMHPWMTGRGDLLQQNVVDLSRFKENHTEQRKKPVPSNSVYWLVSRR